MYFCHVQSEDLMVKMFKEDVHGRKLDLILIGPLRDQSKRVTSKHSIGMTAHCISLTSS